MCIVSRKRSPASSAECLCVIDTVTRVPCEVGRQWQITQAAAVFRSFPGVHFIFILLPQSKQCFSYCSESELLFSQSHLPVPLPSAAVFPTWRRTWTRRTWFALEWLSSELWRISSEWGGCVGWLKLSSAQLGSGSAWGNPTESPVWVGTLGKSRHALLCKIKVVFVYSG